MLASVLRSAADVLMMSSHIHCASFLLVTYTREEQRCHLRSGLFAGPQWTAINLGCCEVKLVRVCEMSTV